jgi:hypothetical protein
MKDSLYLELTLSATEWRTLVNCNSVQCALEQALTEKVSFLEKYILEFLQNENLQGPNNFRLIEP